MFMFTATLDDGTYGTLGRMGESHWLVSIWTAEQEERYVLTGDLEEPWLNSVHDNFEQAAVEFISWMGVAPMPR